RSRQLARRAGRADGRQPGGRFDPCAAERGGSPPAAARAPAAAPVRRLSQGPAPATRHALSGGGVPRSCRAPITRAVGAASFDESGARQKKYVLSQKFLASDGHNDYV